MIQTVHRKYMGGHQYVQYSHTKKGSEPLGFLKLGKNVMGDINKGVANAL